MFTFQVFPQFDDFFSKKMFKIIFLILYFSENGNFIVEQIYPNSRKNRCPE